MRTGCEPVFASDYSMRPTVPAGPTTATLVCCTNTSAAGGYLDRTVTSIPPVWVWRRMPSR
jgi:hypothetical protein